MNHYSAQSPVKRVYLLIAFLLCFGLHCVAQTSITISATGTWTAPLGVTSVTVEAWGGGGGGGGGNTNLTAGGGGGGGGAYILNSSVPVIPNTTYNITIGNGGAGGAGDADGSPGGITTAVFGSTTVSANGGTQGISAETGGIGGAGGTFSGGTGANGFTVLGGSGGGGGGSAGNGSNGNNGSSTNGGAAVIGGGAGGDGGAQVGPGTDGSVPGGGGGGGAWWALGFAGGNGAAGQVVLTYTVMPTCTPPCPGWIIQNCTVCAQDCYVNAGTIATPLRTLQTTSISRDTSNFGYIYWTFNASADSTYYFDLCSSTGTTGSSWLRLHNARNTNPNNNYCMDSSSTPTLVLQNNSNGCTGTGIGLSKLIWTCQSSGTYYLESAIGLNMIPWGVTGSQTAVLSYKTLPSFSYTCSDVFYDKGTDGTDGSTMNYNNDENWIYTYYPTDTTTDKIHVQFVSFNTSPGDDLCIYNGNSINAPLLGCFSGPSITGAFTSTASDGSLTFQFTSDDSLIAAGWQANISCVSSLGIGSYGLANKISIYPNPVKDILEVSGLKYDANTKIQVFDVIGKSVYINQPTIQTQNSQSKTMVDVNALSAGIYFIRIENETGEWNGRFVKQ